jgi:hypothetical protein
MKNTYIILKKETSRSLREQPGLPTAFAGFLLKISVDEVNDITDHIFVMQRDVNSNYVDDVLDSFYSVASVGEIELIPEDNPDENGTNFFRTNSIELMFQSAKELEDAWTKIKSDVSALAIANDASFDIDNVTIHSFPPNRIPRFYGKSSDSNIDASSIKLSLNKDFESSSTLSVSETLFAGDYFYVCLHTSFGNDMSIHLDGVQIDTVVTTVSLEIFDGVSVNYNLFRTANPMPNLTVGTWSIK